MTPSDKETEMTDLTTTYLGLTLRTPIIASAGPYTRDVDHAKADPSR